MLFRLNSFSDKVKVKEYIDRLPDKRYEVSINIHRDKRSYDQNRLMWLWLACISEETGYESEELHEYFKNKHLSHKEVTVFGEHVDKTVSTKNLNTLQFKEYLDKIQKFASSELGIILPNPEDHVFPEFEEQYKSKI